MSAALYDVVAVGNAIVDIQQRTPEDFLGSHGIAKGAMTLIEEDRALYLTGVFAEATLAAGGSAANTVTGVASFGGKAAYIGKVADDALGERFTREFRAAGVAFDTPPRPGPPGTARCVIAITPDGQRSMSTYLGCSTLLTESDLDAALIRSGRLTFLEGYLFDREDAKRAFVKAAEIAKGAGRQVALTLSDVFCVERHRESFQHLVRGHIDVLFANEAELLALYQTGDLDQALATARRHCPIVAVTRSEKGSLVAGPEGDMVVVTAASTPAVIDTTGAGDLYAAGFLFGLARGKTLGDCGRLGSIAAAEVISHMGPRPEVPLKDLAAAAGL
ncbi:MAG: adenosine kinase [Alphaproteobacteria bacterium]|jgi:sugar/nucleoside kinase (ribokinase family)|nr:adenosine kinase [Alphaproteobacteria bacterium]